MSEVDINNDSLTRFVVKHYKYDQKSNHYSHLNVIAFNNKHEMKNKIKKLNNHLDSLKSNNVAYKKEYFYGVIYKPEHFAKTNQMHLINKMIRHGVSPTKHLPPDQISGLLYTSKLPKQKPRNRISSILGGFKRFK